MGFGMQLSYKDGDKAGVFEFTTQTNDIVVAMEEGVMELRKEAPEAIVNVGHIWKIKEENDW